MTDSTKPEALLGLYDIAVSYGKVDALTGVTIDVAAGSIVTVIGANGAGKTSLLNAAMGLVPSTGSVMIGPEELRYRRTEERLARGLALVPERRELFGTMTVVDNLVLGGYLRTTAEVRSQLAQVYERFPRLAERRTQIAGTLSGGERQMLAMGRALMGSPEVLMLDEPSLGLAPRIVADILQIVVDLKASGVAVLLVEQNARAALAIADHAYVMELGKVTLSGPARVLADDPRVIESYLGLAQHPITLED
jgi:branched-chain amino acid transport system ATP-binding protein